MTPPQINQVSALQSQMTDLGARMDRGFEELKTIMSGVETRVRALETREAGCQPLTQARLDAAWREIDAQEAQIKALTEIIAKLSKSIEELATRVTKLEEGFKLVKWAGGLIAGSVITWIVLQTLGLIK